MNNKPSVVQSPKFRPSVTLCMIVCLLAALTSGCWDRTEINDIAIVLATAIDLEENGDYKVSLFIPLPEQLGNTASSGGEGGTGGGKPYYIDAQTGRSTIEAIAKLQMRMSRILNFSHRRVFVVNSSIVREHGLEAVFNPLARLNENRMTSYLLITEERADDLLHVEPRMEAFSAEFMRELAKSKYIENINMKQIAYMDESHGVDAFIPLVEAVPKQAKDDSPEIQLQGYAIFKHSIMVGTLKGEKAQALNIVRNQPKPYLFPLSIGKKGHVTLEIVSGHTKVTPSIKDRHAHFNIDAKIEVEIVENNSTIDYSKQSSIRQLSQQVNNHLKEVIEQTMKQCLELRSDPMGFGLHLYRHFPREWNEYYKHDWNDKLSNATFDVHVSTKVWSPGLYFQNLNPRGETSE